MYDSFVPEEHHPKLCTLIMYLPNDAYYAKLVARSVTLCNILLSKLDALYIELGCNLSSEVGVDER